MTKTFGIVDTELARLQAIKLKDNAFHYGTAVTRFGFNSDEAQEAKVAVDIAMDNLLIAIKGDITIDLDKDNDV